MSHHFWPYTIDADEAPPLDADRYLVWLARHQWRTILGGVLFGVPWMLSIALVPAAIGKAIDGLVAHDEKALLVWSGAIMGLGLISAVTTDGRHWFAVRNWLIASFRTAVVTERAVRRAGPALTRRMPAGEVVTSFASDFWRIGNAYDVTARMAGAIVSFLVVSVILLRGSVVLGVIMLVGGPILLASLALVMRPLQRRQAAQRHEAGLLTSLGADTVAGLRVLRGIGGEDTFLTRYAAQSGRVRGAGVRLSGIQATLDAAQVLLPGIFVIIVTGVGAHLAVAGEITPGQLVAFYGYTAFLTMPLRTATEFVDKMIRARVGARRVVTILGVEPDHASTQSGATLNGHVVDLAAALVDPVTGVVIEPGRVTALVSARPEETAELAHRLGRTRPGRHGVRWGDDPPRRPAGGCRALARRGVRGRPAPVQRSGARGPGRGERRGAARRRVGHQRLRRPRRARARDGRRARGARPGPVGWAAPARRPGPRPAARPRGPRAHRAHERGRRPHRGADRRAAGRPTGPGAPRCWSPRARCCSTGPTSSCSSSTVG